MLNWYWHTKIVIWKWIFYEFAGLMHEMHNSNTHTNKLCMFRFYQHCCHYLCDAIKGSTLCYSVWFYQQRLIGVTFCAFLVNSLINDFFFIKIHKLPSQYITSTWWSTESHSKITGPFTTQPFLPTVLNVIDIAHKLFPFLFNFLPIFRVHDAERNTRLNFMSKYAVEWSFSCYRTQKKT